MTGATAVVWFRSRRRKKTQPGDSPGVNTTKSPGVREAQRAVQESATRQREVSGQRGIVDRVVSSLAEVRRENNFAENIREAMLGRYK